jgi:hypothetical protein
MEGDVTVQQLICHSERSEESHAAQDRLDE